MTDRWLPATTVVPSDSSRITYSNLHLLSAENGGHGRLYNFLRGLNASFKPSFIFDHEIRRCRCEAGNRLAQVGCFAANFHVWLGGDSGRKSLTHQRMIIDNENSCLVFHNDAPYVGESLRDSILSRGATELRQCVSSWLK